MTHAELVQVAAKWLRARCAVVITEMTSGAAEQPDAIGFNSYVSTLVECKTSRADFFADRKKLSRMGYYRYYLTAPGLLQISDIPEGWGLLEVDGRGVTIVHDPPRNVAIDDRDIGGELSLLVSCFRRLGKLRQECCVSVKYYTYVTKNRATLGVAE